MEGGDQGEDAEEEAAEVDPEIQCPDEGEGAAAGAVEEEQEEFREGGPAEGLQERLCENKIFHLSPFLLTPTTKSKTI